MAIADIKRRTDSTRPRRCAARLQALGWSSEDIEKILAGPQQSSIHDIAGDQLPAWSVKSVEAVSVADDEPIHPPLGPAPENSLDIGQKQIADAVWASVNAGDPIPLATIARQIKKLSPPLQAYLLAASLDVKWFYKDLNAWKRDFDRAQKEAASKRKRDGQEAEGLAQAGVTVVTAVATAAAAANAVPIVGQAVSAALAVGLAVAVAILEANPLPVRKSEDQVRPGYEGVSVFWGFIREPTEDPYENSYNTLKQAVVQDPVAFSLPQVPQRTPFDFAPRLAAFQEAAHQLGLYPEDGAKT